MKRKNYVQSIFVCKECGMNIPLPRIHGRQREKNHVKDIYCPRCKKVSKFKEVRYKEFFINLDGQVVYV